MEWFIAGIFPRIYEQLIQKMFTSQHEALETTMKLEASLVGDGGGMAQVQTQVSLNI
jgi:hypothetical protein